DAGHPRAALGRRAAIGLALQRRAVAELALRAGDVGARIVLALARDAPLAPGALARDAEILAGTSIAVRAGRAIDPEAGVLLAAAHEADVGGIHARQLGVVAVDAAAADAGLRRVARHLRAQVDALAGVLVALHAGRAGLALAAQGNAELVHALVSGRAGHLDGDALLDTLAVAAAEPRRALRGRVDDAVAVVVLAVAHLGRGRHAAFAYEAHLAAADQAALLAGAVGRVDLRLGEARAQALLARLREGPVVDDAVAVV